MTSAPRGPGSGTGSDIALLVLCGGVGVALVLWLSGASAILLSGHRVPHSHLLAGVLALGHLHDPGAAWGGDVGPPLLYWLVTASCLTVVAALGVAGYALARRWSRRSATRPDRIEGLAERHEVRHAAGSTALVAHASQLRPSLSRAVPSDLGYLIGRSRGIACYMSVEDSAVVLGPPRSGKGLQLVIPMILDAPGAVVTTSTRPDNLTATIAARARDGRPVAVFDPQGLAPGISSATRWSPIRGCEQAQVAIVRARALCADAGSGTENGTFWAQQTIAAVRCLLHAAALGHCEPLDLYSWSLSPIAAREAVAILVSSHRAARAWDEALDAIISADQRQRDSTWAMVANTFAALADPDVLDAVSPDEHEQFDPVAFLRSCGTLYLLGTASGAVATSGLVAAFVEDIVETARRLAAASPGARLDPPVGLVLDEAANYCLPSLSSLVSEGGGTGITTIAVLQSLAQARDRWGRDATQAIWDAAITKVVLGGGANADDLADLSRLIGERSVPERSESWSGEDATRSVTIANRQRPILTPDELRRLVFGSALLLCRAAPSIVLEMSPWTSRRDAKELVAARAVVEDAIREASAARDAARATLGSRTTSTRAPIGTEVEQS